MPPEHILRMNTLHFVLSQAKRLNEDFDSIPIDEFKTICTDMINHTNAVIKSYMAEQGYSPKTVMERIDQIITELEEARKRYHAA